MSKRKTAGRSSRSAAPSRGATARTEASEWWRGPLCISDVQFTPDEFRALGAEGVAAALSDLGFNVHEQAFPALPGYEGSYLRAPWRPGEYGALVDACHDRGIRVTPYLNVHGFYAELVEKHPDWPQRLPNGSPAFQGNGRWTPPCYNGPWREFALEAIGTLVREYPIDGIFLDGPAFYAQTCYCPECRRRFRETSCEDLPAWEDWADLRWPAFLSFRRDTVARLLADIRKRLDAGRPGEHLVLYMNNVSLNRSWVHAADTRSLAPFLDILGNERALLFTAPPMSSPLWMVGAAMKILETQARRHGRPIVQYCCFRHLPWDYYGLPAAEYRLYIAGALANGGGAQVMGGWRYLTAELQEVVRDFNHLQRSHPDVFCGSQSAANVALLWPQRTADFGGTQTPMPATTHARILAPRAPNSPPPAAPGISVVQEEFYGWAESLLRGGIPYDVIDEAALEEKGGLSRYAAAVLPAAHCLSEAECASLREYVRRGGHLVVTGASSLCNERDVQQANFGLADVLGGDYGGRSLGPFPIDYIEHCRGVRQTSLPGDAIFSGIVRDVLPAPPAAVAVRPSTGTVLAVHLCKLQTRYEPITRQERPDAAVLINRYGRGSCVWLAGAFGSAYWQHRFADYRRLMLNALLWRCVPPVDIHGARGDSAPADAVELSWRRAADGRWLLHLVNHMGTMNRPIERVVPVRDLVVSLPGLASAGRIHALALCSKGRVGMGRRDGAPWLRVPLLNEYDVIVISAR